MKTKLCALAACTGLALGLTGPQALAAPAAPTRSAESINAEMDHYADTHPHDYTGLDKLVRHYTGQPLRVAVNGINHPLTGAQADAVLAKRERVQSGQIHAEGGIPPFNVSVAAYALLSDADDPVMSAAGVSTAAVSYHQVRFLGQWDYPDNWGGAMDPDDIAVLQFVADGCYSFSNYAAGTFTYDNRGTGQAYLKDANIRNTSPIWAVNDYMSAFSNKADHGYVGVRLDNTRCNGRTHTVTSAFTYEGNAGGGNVLSVSAGWGAVSVSYSKAPMVRQQGTPPIQKTF